MMIMKRNYLLLLICLMFCSMGCSNSDHIETVLGQNDTKEIYIDSGGDFGIGMGLYIRNIDGSRKKRLAKGDVVGGGITNDWVYYIILEKGKANDEPNLYVNLYTGSVEFFRICSESASNLY